MNNLVDKYNIPAPRYTSYPTVPYWNTSSIQEEIWVNSAIHSFHKNKEVSLYIHLPFCENLCTYCGCNKRITKNHGVEQPYIETVILEWNLYLASLPYRPIIRELHLGGGTPTFFSPKNLDRLMEGILSDAVLANDYEFSFEAHPNNTQFDHLMALYDWGFRRISIGVQDFSDDILQLINRRQTVEDVQRVTYQARAIGYESINYDIIFGLPTQTEANIHQTAQKIKELKPDRIAYYSYAHVPWVKPSQRAYSEADLPKGIAKRRLYDLGRSHFEDCGYSEIGLDHFALSNDELFVAQKNGTLYRNFMGYTPRETNLMVGLGASAISDSWGAYIQNEKGVEAYQNRVHDGEIPIFKGHLLTEEDKVLRRHILNLMCHYKTNWLNEHLQSKGLYEGLHRMTALEADGLIQLKPYELTVTESGKPFIRNICMALDEHHWRKARQGQIFSKAI